MPVEIFEGGKYLATEWAIPATFVVVRHQRCPNSDPRPDTEVNVVSFSQLILQS